MEMGQDLGLPKLDFFDFCYGCGYNSSKGGRDGRGQDNGILRLYLTLRV